jgi:hypothetical protein
MATQAINGPRSTQFEPNDLLYSQWAALHQPGYTPEQNLALAVLLEAKTCLEHHAMGNANSTRNTIAKTRLADEARQWIASAADYPFSFVWICHALDFDVTYWRTALLARYATDTQPTPSDLADLHLGE